ncbi:hypothetical protein [Amycolatopsis orientalis]|uniref:hypothetical protein n=1 Tax=Amycolatopsis orientalis TaxID=31958 RepID=UPI0004199B71|nr:hypothetical protein [Amycolatopsis orientalis]
MKVIDPEGRGWVVDRRFAPWRRWVQPFAGLTGGYRHYELTAYWKLESGDGVEGHEDTPVDKVLVGTVGVLVALEALVKFPVYLLLGIFLLPFLLLEMAGQAVAGSVARLVRWFRNAPARVDVAGWHKDQSGLVSLTILRVHDDLAKPLTIELCALLRERVMFDPGEPAVREALTRFGARVESHRTLLWRRSVSGSGHR